jgi:glycosyltransferase involved in cell wall biosynthesis
LSRPELSVVLPCYNEEKNLSLILESYVTAAPNGLFWELLLVDNGSTDNSARVLTDLLARPAYAFARVVSVEVNQGYGFGMTCGLKAARGEVLAFSHADMQCDPASVFGAYAAWKSAGGGKVLVKGRRQGRPWRQKVLTLGMSALATLWLWRRLSDINAQPKLFPASLLERLTRAPKGFEFDVYVLERALACGYRLVTIPVFFGERAHGQSKWASTFFSRWKTILRVAFYIMKLRFSFEQNHGRNA